MSPAQRQRFLTRSRVEHVEAPSSNAGGDQMPLRARVVDNQHVADGSGGVFDIVQIDLG
jgi:hypothetical protein